MIPELDGRMEQHAYQANDSRVSLVSPPLMTVIVYVGLLFVYQFGELDSFLGRILLVPAVLGVLIVPILTIRALGHTLLSMVGGGQLMRFTSGPFLIQRENGELQFGANTRWSRYAGSAVTAPSPSADLRRWIRWRELGPFAGLAVYTLLVLLISNWLQAQSFVADDADLSRIVSTVSFALIVLVITLGVWQLINRHVPRIWRMSRGGPAADREAAIVAMTSLILVGRRPHEWPEAWPATAVWDEDESVEGLYGHRFAYLYALDTGDMEAADRHFRELEEHADRLPKRMREHLVDLERPFVEAWIRGNVAEARAHLDQMVSTVIERYRFRRIQAAVLLAEGEPSHAREMAIEGLNAGVNKRDDGEVLAELAVLEEILDRTGGDIDASISDEDRDPIEESEPASGVAPHH